MQYWSPTAPQKNHELGSPGEIFGVIFFNGTLMVTVPRSYIICIASKKTFLHVTACDT